MKIVVLTSSLSSGGAERVATTLCNSWVNRGDEVTLVATYSGGGRPFYAISSKIDIVYLADCVERGTRGVLGYKARLLALRRLIASRSPDVVISFLPNVNVAAILATAGLRLPLIICERSDPTRQPYTGFWKAACRLTYRFSDMLTVQTDAVAEKAAMVFPKLKRVRTVPNPLPDGVTKIERAEPVDRKVLLSLGRLSAEKQVDRIIDGFSEIAAEFEDWDLHVYGDGPQRADLERLVRQYGLEGRVFLKGRTSDPWSVMAGADGFIMASLYEGFPNALLEAMGIGLPCIAFDCPSGPREISNNGEHALLVEMNDQVALVSAIRRMASDGGLRAALGQSARESIIARFALASVLSRWDQLFKEVGAIS